MELSDGISHVIQGTEELLDGVANQSWPESPLTFHDRIVPRQCQVTGRKFQRLKGYDCTRTNDEFGLLG